VQTIDLEDFAAHRGSVFGAVPGTPQPSQKMFESRIAAAIEGLDRTRPVVIEAEASKIGDRSLPPSLWKAMMGGKRIVISAPIAARARYLVERYAAAEEGRAQLGAALDGLVVQHGRKTIMAWRALLEAGQFESLAADLIERHYDPAYGRVAARDARPIVGAIALGGLAPADLESAADEVAILAAGQT
jgi:tRNA 2-selenouridine synthase